MIEDPVVEEVHRTRERLLEEHGGLAGYLAHIRNVQAAMPDRVVRLPRRAVTTDNRHPSTANR